MGGKNHQPTRSLQLIAPSAWLSQKLGEGLIAVHQANSELENAIMVAMDRLHVEHLTKHLVLSPIEYLNRTVSHLETSLFKISELQDGYKHLLRAASAEGYKGNPLASTIKELDLSARFNGKLILPTINADAWQAVESRIAASNILDTLEWESSEFDQLRRSTTELKSVVEDARTILTERGNRAFVEAVEWNRVPLRQFYARVFSLWNHLDAMFLYSALMMTELFYRAHNLPSLLDDNPEHSDASQVA